jgi:hypothetical protein
MAAAMSSNADDPDFVSKMGELVGLDEEAVEKLLDGLDNEQLQDLTDAVAKGDAEAIQALVNRFTATDEEVNTLFRGANLDAVESKKNTRRHNRRGDLQFTIGDEVEITVIGDDGKRRRVTATVERPEGPEGTDTMLVRVEGKPIVVHKKNVTKLDEGVIGMVGLPPLHRMQQLAGLTTTPETSEPAMPAASFEVEEPEADNLGCPTAQAMAALDALEAALPNIVLADLKAVRSRLMALQASLNENVGVYGRAKK